MITELSGAAGYSGRQRVAIIVSAMLGFGLDMYNVLILTFVLGAIRTSLHISLAQSGLVATATLIGSVIGGASFGIVGDRYGRKTALQLALAVFSIGAIASAFAPGFGVLVVLRFVTGIGLGGEWGAGMVLFNEVWNPKHRGIGSACIQSSAVTGTAIASIVGIWAVGNFGAELGWRIALLTGGAPIFLMVFVRYAMPESKIWLAYKQQRNTTDASMAPERVQDAQWTALLRAPHKLRLLGGITWLASYMFTFYAIVIFLPTLWIKSMGVPPGMVRSIVLIGTPISIAAYLILGVANDRMGRRFGAVLPACLWIVSLLLMAYYAKVPYAGSLVAWPMFWSYLLYVSGCAALGVAGPWISEMFPVGLRSTAASSIYMSGRAIGSLAPVVVPIAAAFFDGSLLLGMLVAIPSALLFLGVSFLLPETSRNGVAVLGSGSRANAYAPQTINADLGQ